MANDSFKPKQRSATRRQVVAGTTAAAALTMIDPLAHAQVAGGPVHIKASDVTVEGRKAIINNGDLALALKNDKSGAAQDLQRHFSSLKANQVSLDKDGRVVIANDDAAKRLKAFVESNRAAEKNAQ